MFPTVIIMFQLVVHSTQVRKLQERVQRAKEEVQRTKEKYEAALQEINSYNPKYMEDMQEVFDKCQQMEAQRLTFFKEVLFNIHKGLNISQDPTWVPADVSLFGEELKLDVAIPLRDWGYRRRPTTPNSIFFLFLHPFG